MSCRRLSPHLAAALGATLALAALARPAAAAAPPRFTTPSAAGPARAVPTAAGLEGKGVRLRTTPRVRAGAAPQAAVVPYARFLARAPGWQMLWDEATAVPLRLHGAGLPAPAASGDPAAAAAHARGVLAAHLDLLAPGARAADFVLVANVARNGVRTVGFRQHVGGLEVIGGQVSFRYKRDRLIAIGSEALPGAVAALPAAGRAVAPGVAGLMAATWMMADLGAAAHAGTTRGPFVLPLVGDGGVLGYRTVLRVAVDSPRPRGAWDVYVDAQSGAPVARRQTLAFADGEVTFDVPLRRPGADRARLPARGASFEVDGAAVESDDEGVVSWAGAAAGTLVTRARGPLVRVHNQDGPDATESFALPASGKVTWDASDEVPVDAQLTAFIHARLIKDFVRERFAADLAWLDDELEVNVNIDDQCNAFSDGDSINFFASSQQCENTARLADVVYHEFGHSLHYQSIVDGAGAFDGAFSEGLSDYLAATYTGDPGMGRGFFKDDSPLRHIDPPDREHAWPEDIAEVHSTGLIFAGAMWDLRKLLIEKHGADAGARRADLLFYGAVQRASTIPATYLEILVEDDDDGDLSNGTPDICEINAAFAPHGLRQVAVDLEPLGVEAVAAEGHTVGLRVSGLLPQCAGDGVTGAEISWLPRGRSNDEAQAVPMVEADGRWSGVIPAQPDGTVVRYRVTLTFTDGSTQQLPDNPADPRYEYYVGEVVELYCTDFESDPFADGGDWRHELVRGTDRPGSDDWTWGAPMASGSSGDPATAYSGTGVIGNDLGGDGNGQYAANIASAAIGPRIETGTWSDVRLQYRRWLNVEDAFFDQATIEVNGREAWKNFDSNDGDQSATQHTDRDWRFHDVPLSHLIDDGSAELAFGLSTDGGLEFGGWTIDDLCVVAAAGKICGDGVHVSPEECDDGEANSDDTPDACRANCRAPACGDGVVDADEACDDGNQVDGDGCLATCAREDEGGDCGCRVGVGAGPTAGTLGLALLGLLALVRLRARPRRPGAASPSL